VRSSVTCPSADPVDLTAGSRRLRALADPTRIEYGIASSVVIGALSLIDPARLSFGQRVAFRCLTAAVTSVLVLIELRRVESLEANPVAKAGVAVGVAGTVLGLSEASEKLDARIVSGIERAGVRRPRLALAAVSTALSIAAFRSGTVSDGTVSDVTVDGPVYFDIAPEISALVDGMLALTTNHSSAALQAQWATAREEHWAETEPGEFGRWLEFSVDESTPRAVPHTFTFPVKARFLAPSGIPAEASLLISDGRLRSLLVDVVQGADGLEDFDDGDPLDGLDAWPAVADVTFVIDTP
jgi:hypothetical protein